MLTENFIECFTGHIFKIIPLKEAECNGENVHLLDYINGIAIEALGAMTTFKELSIDPDFITVINILNYLKEHDVSERVCKREAFKMLAALNAISRRLDGDADV